MNDTDLNPTHDETGPHYPYRTRLKRETENIQGEIKRVMTQIKKLERMRNLALLDAENMRGVDPSAARAAENQAKRLDLTLANARGELRRLRKKEREQKRAAKKGLTGKK